VENATVPTNTQLYLQTLNCTYKHCTLINLTYISDTQCMAYRYFIY